MADNEPPRIDAGSLTIASDGRLGWPSSTTDAPTLHSNNVLLAIPTATGHTVAVLKDEADQAPQLILLSTTEALPATLRPRVLERPPAHLAADTAVDVVVSTNSGTGAALEFWQGVLGPLLRLVTGHPPRSVLITDSAESVAHFAEQLWSRTNDAPTSVILLSGDGGIVDLLNHGRKDASAAPRPTVALVPLGTGNALFHSLHKPVYVDEGPSALVVAVRTLFSGAAAPLPVFRATFGQGSRLVIPGTDEDGDSVDYLDGAVVASYGFHASLTYESDTPAYRVHGDKRFRMVAQELLRESHAYAASVEVTQAGSTSKIPRDKHGYVLASLVSNLERGFTISPDSRPLDGQLRLVNFGDIGGERAMEAMMKAYDGGKHVDVKWEDGQRVHYDAFDELRVTAGEDDARWRVVCIDGTVVRLPQGGSVHVRVLESSPLRIVVDRAVLP